MVLAAAIAIAASELTSAAPPPPPPLAESVRARIWEIEHAALVLERVAFSAFTEDCGKGDPVALLGHFSKRAVQGAVIRDLAADLVKTVEGARNVRRSIRVISLDKTESETSGDSRWEGEGILRVWGEHENGGPWESVSMFDFQARLTDAESVRSGGWLESFLILETKSTSAPSYFFKEVTSASGLEPDRWHDNWHPYSPTVLNTGGIYVEDLDRDGLLDLLVTDIGAGLVYYRGEPDGKFKDVTVGSGLQAERVIAAAIADLDSDGWPDVISGSPTGSLRIFRNRGEGKFEAVPDVGEFGLGHLASSVSARNIPVALAPADFDGDGLIDLYLVRVSQESHHRGMLIDGASGPESAGQLLKNLGGFRFGDVSEKTEAAIPGLSTFAAAWFYAGEDPFPDLFLTHEFGRGVLLENKDGKRFDSKKIGVHGSGFGSMGVATGDIDGDLRTDLYVSSMYSKAGSRVLENVPSDAFPVTQLATLKRLAAGGEIYVAPDWREDSEKRGGTKIGWSWGCSLADFDNDSALDLFVTSGFVSRDRAKPDG